MKEVGVGSTLGEVRRELEFLARRRLVEPLTPEEQELYDLLKGREVLLSIGRPRGQLPAHDGGR